MKVDPVMQAHRPLVVAAAAVLPLVACAVAQFHDSVANTNAALGLVLLVVTVASTGIRVAGIVAALSSAAGFDYFLTEPYNTFNLSDRGDFETAVLLLLVGAAVTEVAPLGASRTGPGQPGAGLPRRCVGTAATVAAGRASTDDLIDLMCRQIVEILQIDGCRFDPGTRSGLPALDLRYRFAERTHDRRVPQGLAHRFDDCADGAQRGVTHGQLLLTAATRLSGRRGNSFASQSRSSIRLAPRSPPVGRPGRYGSVNRALGTAVPAFDRHSPVPVADGAAAVAAMDA